MSDKILYDGKYRLESYEIVFLEMFRDTHSLDKALKQLTQPQRTRVNGTLRTGKSDLAKAFKSFIEQAPLHPSVNKVVILDTLVWVMNQAKADEDTQGVIRAIAEINKMIKGNLVNSVEKTVIEKQFVGLIDLSKKPDDDSMIDITHETLKE